MGESEMGFDRQRAAVASSPHRPVARDLDKHRPSCYAPRQIRGRAAGRDGNIAPRRTTARGRAAPSPSCRVPRRHPAAAAPSSPAPAAHPGPASTAKTPALSHTGPEFGACASSSRARRSASPWRPAFASPTSVAKSAADTSAGGLCGGRPLRRAALESPRPAAGHDVPPAPVLLHPAPLHPALLPPQHRLYFLPLPQLQGSFLPGFTFTFTFTCTYSRSAETAARRNFPFQECTYSWDNKFACARRIGCLHVRIRVGQTGQRSNELLVMAPAGNGMNC